uniref:Gag polyprotein n=1 Tax=Macrostomum lignano TaxID=282301 RepID=A0A1I8FNI8_9PLAT
QTDEEKQRGLPIVDAGCLTGPPATCRSRRPASSTSSCERCSPLGTLLENMNNNYAYWKQLADQAKNAAPEAGFGVAF